MRAQSGELEIEVASRDGAVLLRPRDPAYELRRNYRPTPLYPPSPQWVVPATFTPYDEPPTDESVGEVAFTLACQRATLVAFDDEGGLWLVFWDATAGQTTYPAGR